MRIVWGGESFVCVCVLDGGVSRSEQQHVVILVRNEGPQLDNMCNSWYEIAGSRAQGGHSSHASRDWFTRSRPSTSGWSTAAHMPGPLLGGSAHPEVTATVLKNTTPMTGYSALTHTRHSTQRIPGVPGSAKRLFVNRGCDVLSQLAGGTPAPGGVSAPRPRAHPLHPNKIERR